MSTVISSPPASDVRVHRCPACGQRFRPPPPRHCELCGFALSGPPTTGMDITPYAAAYSQGERGWGRMVRWMCFGGGERIHHLALMRASSASARFCMWNLILLSVAAMLVHLAQVGWVVRAEDEPPRGDAWVRVVLSPRPLVTSAAIIPPKALWWNPRMSGLAALMSLASALLVSWLTLAVVRGMIEALHSTAYRGEGRMTAALHYSTAFLVVSALGGCIFLFTPLAEASRLGDWRVGVSPLAVEIAAGVAAAIGLLMNWVFLLRLGATAPVRCRTRVVLFCSMGVPLLAGLAGAGWHLGMTLAYGEIARALGWT